MKKVIALSTLVALMGSTAFALPIVKDAEMRTARLDAKAEQFASLRDDMKELLSVLRGDGVAEDDDDYSSEDDDDSSEDEDEDEDDEEQGNDSSDEDDDDDSSSDDDDDDDSDDD